MSLARCSRCESFFCPGTEEARGCRYHTGQYRAWWSCCKEPLFGALGCHVGSHQEDRSYTAMLDSLCLPAAEPLEQGTECFVEGPDGRLMAVAGLIVTQIPSGQPRAVDVCIDPDEQDEASSNATPPPASSTPAHQGGGDGQTVAVPYVVGSHDTFASICLKHRMSSEELLRLNGLRHRRARVGDVLLVWSERSDIEQNEDLQRQQLRQFRRLTGSSAAEALYYMEE